MTLCDLSMVTELRMIQYINLQIHMGYTFPVFFDSWLYHLNPKASKTIQCTLKSSCATCEMVISFFFNLPRPRVFGRMNRYFFSAWGLYGIYPWPLDRWTFLDSSVSHEFEGPCSNHSRRLDFHVMHCCSRSPHPDCSIGSPGISWACISSRSATTLVIWARNIPAFVSKVQSWSIAILRICHF